MKRQIRAVFSGTLRRNFSCTAAIRRVAVDMGTSWFACGQCFEGCVDGRVIGGTAEGEWEMLVQLFQHQSPGGPVLDAERGGLHPWFAHLLVLVAEDRFVVRL